MDTDRAAIGRANTLVANPAPAPRAEDTAVPSVTGEAGQPFPRRAASKRPWWILAALGGAMVMAAAVFAAVRFTVQADKADLGVDVTDLPPSTTTVVAARARSDLWGTHAATEGQLTSWWAARLCGGFDVASALELAAGSDLHQAESLGLNALADPLALREPLACGRKLARAVGQPRVTEVAWTDGTSNRRVLGIWLDAAKTPSWADGVDGVLRGKTWFAGTPADVKAFESHRGGAQPSGVVQELFGHATPMSNTALVSAPSTVDLTLPCSMVAPPGAEVRFLQHCFPVGFAKQNESLAIKLRGAAIARDTPTESGRVRLELRLVAKDDAAATFVNDGLRSFWEQMLAVVDQNEVQLSKLVKNRGSAEVLLDPWLRALRNTTIAREGTVIHVIADAPLRDDELVRARAAAKEAGPLSAEIDAIVAALGKGDPVPMEALGRIVGDDAAIWLASPQAKSEDCAAISAHAGSLPVDEKQFGMRFEIQATWAPDNCAHLLPAKTRQCLLGAKDIVAMSNCEVPAHPDVVAARTFLAGKWQALAKPDDHSLHIAGDAATFVLDGVTGAGAWKLQSAKDETLIVSLPIRGGQRDFVIERVTPHMLRMRLPEEKRYRVLQRQEGP